MILFSINFMCKIHEFFYIFLIPPVIKILCLVVNKHVFLLRLSMNDTESSFDLVKFLVMKTIFAALIGFFIKTFWFHLKSVLEMIDIFELQKLTYLRIKYFKKSRKVNCAVENYQNFIIIGCHTVRF